MNRLFRRPLVLGRWCFALLLTVGLFGCKTWGNHDDSLRDNGLSSAARKARPEKKNEEKNGEYWGWSDKSRQIERDLNGQ
ncbi:MAG: hypothetical protein LLG00_13065 [Planctomycetaceae bacterium]|nr:hypothetical protein [Planctomycetaceae bacterium]